MVPSEMPSYLYSLHLKVCLCNTFIEVFRAFTSKEYRLLQFEYGMFPIGLFVLRGCKLWNLQKVARVGAGGQSSQTTSGLHLAPLSVS